MKVRNTKDPKFTHERSSFRLTTMEDEPVYLRVNFGGEINLQVAELGGGGARVLCYRCQTSFEDFLPGHSLGKAVLVLPEKRLHEVKPVVRWKGWPCVGVQFMELTDKARADIYKFLFDLERKKLKRMNMMNG